MESNAESREVSMEVAEFRDIVIQGFEILDPDRDYEGMYDRYESFMRGFDVFGGKIRLGAVAFTGELLGFMLVTFGSFGALNVCEKLIDSIQCLLRRLSVEKVDESSVPLAAGMRMVSTVIIMTLAISRSNFVPKDIIEIGEELLLRYDGEDRRLGRSAETMGFCLALATFYKQSNTYSNRIQGSKILDTAWLQCQKLSRCVDEKGVGYKTLLGLILASWSNKSLNASDDSACRLLDQLRQLLTIIFDKYIARANIQLCIGLAHFQMSQSKEALTCFQELLLSLRDIKPSLKGEDESEEWRFLTSRAMIGTAHVLRKLRLTKKSEKVLRGVIQSQLDFPSIQAANMPRFEIIVGPPCQKCKSSLYNCKCLPDSRLMGIEKWIEALFIAYEVQVAYQLLNDENNRIREHELVIEAKAFALMEMGKPDDALVLCRKGIQSFPENIHLRVYMADALSCLNCFVTAIEVLDEAIRILKPCRNRTLENQSILTQIEMNRALLLAKLSGKQATKRAILILRDLTSSNFDDEELRLQLFYNFALLLFDNGQESQAMETWIHERRLVVTIPSLREAEARHTELLENVKSNEEFLKKGNYSKEYALLDMIAIRQKLNQILV